MIRALKKSDIKGLNSLPPLDWKLDYEAFLKDFMNADYFVPFIQFQNHTIVGTGNVFIKGKVGWLANIIVDKNHRGKGLGYKMTEFLLKYLIDRGCETQLLIATQLGEPVYRKLGFRKITEYFRFDSMEDRNYSMSSSIRKLDTIHLEAVCQLDQKVNGEDRSHLIQKFYANGFGYFSNDNNLRGFYLPEFGRGLVLAEDQKAGIELLKLKHSKKSNRTLLPIENRAGIEFLEKLGLQKGETSSKMFFGKEINWMPENMYSYGSGYCG